MGKTTRRIFRYAPGSTVYVCQKAQKGVLEAVYIKKVRLNGANYVPIYITTWNYTYAEDELCTQQDAITAAILYYQAQLADINVGINILCENEGHVPYHRPHRHIVHRNGR